MKNQKLSLLAVVSACLLALFGCSPSDSGGSSGGATLSGELAKVQGTWVTSCYFNGTLYVKETFTVSGTTISDHDNYYTDASCANLSFSEDGTYSSLSIDEDNPVTFTDGTTGYRFSAKTTSYTINVRTTQVADSLNSQALCGDTNWAANTPNELSGKVCDGVSYPPINTTWMNLYNLIGSNILFGTPSIVTYPTTVNTSMVYVKQ